MKYLLIFIFAIFLHGCFGYTPPQNHNYVSERVYEKSFDETWDKIIDWFAENHIAARRIDKASGFIESELTITQEESKDVLDCGTDIDGEVAVTFKRSCNMNITVRKAEQGTKVNINMQYFTAASKIQLTNNYYCVSTGVYEKRILDYIGGLTTSK